MKVVAGTCNHLKLLFEVDQLVRVPHHIDCRDLAVLDFERGGESSLSAPIVMNPGNP